MRKCLFFVLLVWIVLALSCQREKHISRETYVEKHLSAELPNGLYYFHTLCGRSDSDSRVILRDYPAGIDLSFDKSSYSFRLKYFVDIGEIRYLHEAKYDMPARVDELMFRYDVLSRERFLSIGIVPTPGETSSLENLQPSFWLLRRGSEPEYAPLAALVSLVQKAFSSRLTTEQQSAAFSELRSTTHYVADKIQVVDVSGEDVAGLPSRYGGYSLRYRIGHVFAQALDKAKTYHYWAIGDISRADRGVILIDIVYVRPK